VQGARGPFITGSCEPHQGPTPPKPLGAWVQGLGGVCQCASVQRAAPQAGLIFSRVYVAQAGLKPAGFTWRKLV
jgi:hypothetical protein